MEVLVTLFYVLFAICVVYPPTEFVSAGFTIAQLFDVYLGSENVNFIGYHMKRITVTALIHSVLPLGYVFCLWAWGSGELASWMAAAASATAVFPLLVCYKAARWWERDGSAHPAVRALLPYVAPGSDWRAVAASLNTEFRSVDKVLLPLTATSKLIATETWIIKVTQYGLRAVKQVDCDLVVTATDSHELSLSGEDEVQYVNIEVVPARAQGGAGVARFAFRAAGGALRELQARLAAPVRLPAHVALRPSRVDRFVAVFRHHVDQNPVYYVDREPEVCIGCMAAPADVKLSRRCEPPPAAPPAAPPAPPAAPPAPPCQQCNCRVLWCCACVARWWAARAGGEEGAARAGGEGGGWLAARCTCPVCRAPFCLLDVAPVRVRAPPPPGEEPARVD